MIRKISLGLYVLVMALLVMHSLARPVGGQYAPGTNYAAFIAGFAAPAITAGVPGAVTATNGTVYLGGTAQAITGGSVTGLASSKSSCTAPTYSSCEIIYASGAGTLNHTATLATATANTNVVVALVTTDANSAILTIVPTTLQSPKLRVD
jgi:hypothetical protein